MTIPNTHCVELSNTITTIRDKSNPLYSKTYCACTTIQLPYNTTINHQNVSVIAGPCSIESEDQIMATAHFVKKAGATILRGVLLNQEHLPMLFRGWELKD